MLLMACSGAAMALGLGDIRVLSKPGQPLVAEIPVISNEPGELDNARVALASATTFARVGLERPQGLVSNLQFQFAQDARGRAVIRVTSSQAVDQPAINFLIEVEWGQGRLVREYSALVDAPNTAAAIAEPAIEAPRAGSSNAIAREPAPVAAPAAQDNARAEPAARATGSASAASATQAGDTLPAVRAGQTLSEIAAAVARSSGHSLDQTMLALLRTNPDAFINGNINRLKQGAVLRTPQEDALAQVGAAEAAVMVREQAAKWRQARSAVPQPAEAGAAAAATPPPATPAAAAGNGARLEIAPAVASQTNKAGVTSGTSAEGEGEMAANQQLQQAKEDIATRDAELQDLRTRVADLEKLKQQQQALIAMKDSDLAAAQKRLSETPAAAQQGGGFPLWLIGGLVLIVAAVVAWLAARRRKPSPLPPLPRRQFDFVLPGAPVQAAEPQEATQATEPSEPDVVHETEFEQADLRDEERAHDAQQPLSDVLRREPLPSEPAAAPMAVNSDDWRALRAAPPVVATPPQDSAPVDAAQAPPHPASEAVEASHADVAPTIGDVPSTASPVAVATQDSLDFERPPAAPSAAPSPSASRDVASAGRDRLELAVAYMDLGDKDTARGLLLEVAATGDDATRAEAAELLERLA
ncbi:FimV/HubP family polar landmark protein [Xanthomonas euvesicatoria]|uniref:Ferrous iron transporter B n=1 Tax=Xanthomonas euvesicatoria pv. euvesicatoria TaxID=2753541 RepID=A0ABS8LTI0_XANEU|nr:FimV/HubP family polar landmark protein [Xanthomonas euvesicatoria]AOY66338.1 ferrous iron transporter B [Xanthomonas euvesicatoria pv. vesicatoria str. 85-10]APO90086.1 ferrous iron transporter B [Xanthomonas euvesicatoria]KLB42095.1 ferrous iron transporter B [Xanthomonas euvesicatoria]MCC8516913.1 ferrous iron transporter B [Xanthomonas euvesicatoria pv. euvesicatoria]MCC8581638.1 ferrous iron transporter B [Xanthomonas euvesicatoria pv. euvesicatoria]